MQTGLRTGWPGPLEETGPAHTVHSSRKTDRQTDTQNERARTHTHTQSLQTTTLVLAVISVVSFPPAPLDSGGCRDGSPLAGMTWFFRQPTCSAVGSCSWLGVGSRSWLGVGSCSWSGVGSCSWSGAGSFSACTVAWAVACTGEGWPGSQQPQGSRRSHPTLLSEVPGCTGLLFFAPICSSVFSRRVPCKS